MAVAIFVCNKKDPAHQPGGVFTYGETKTDESNTGQVRLLSSLPDAGD